MLSDAELTILWAHFSGHSSLNQALASELLEVKAQLSTKLEVAPVNASGLLTTDAQFVGRGRCLRTLRGQCPVEHQASGGAVNASGLWETNTQLGAYLGEAQTKASSLLKANTQP